MLRKYSILTVFVACLLDYIWCIDSELITDDDVESRPLSTTCLKCLCKVMGCIKDDGCANGVCGVMHLTRGYWESAHYKPSGPTNQPAFEKCSNNAWCAVRTVQRYMKRFLPDCEAKRPDRLRCENALALHKLGVTRCDRNLTVATERKLLSCLDRTVWRWLKEDVDD